MTVDGGGCGSILKSATLKSLAEKGYRLKATGSNSVVLIDGRKITHSNMADIKSGMPISYSTL